MNRETIARTLDVATDARGKSSLLAKLALAGVSSLVALLLAEGLFRLVSREKVELHGMYAAAPVVGAGLAPGFEGAMRTREFAYRVSINRLGMRDGPVAPKPAGRQRVLVIGDSFVFGVGVELEASLPKTLARRLDARAGATRYEGLNAGVPGYSTFHAVHTLRRLAPQVAPDLVLLVFFVGDDWFGNVPRPAPGEARKSTVERLRQGSGLYRFVDRFVLGRLKGRERYQIHRRTPSAAFGERIDSVLTLLREARATAGEHGAPLLVALCPRYTQVYDDAWAKAALVYRLDEDEFDPLEPNRTFLERLRQEGFWAVDLLPTLRREARARLLHFPIDGHWNEAGIAVAADVLAETILARGETSAGG